mgnify:CR=1 FL=1
MRIGRHSKLLATAGIVALVAQGVAQASEEDAFSDAVVRLGVLTDMSGPYADWAGNGSVEAVRMAVEDFGGKVGDIPVEVIAADHQNKTDIGVSIARSWYDVEGVDAVFDISNSAVALAVMAVTAEKNRVVVLGGVSTPRVTTDSCTPNSIQYIYDSNALSNVVGKAIVREGGESWYFITVDFAFGHDLEKTTSNIVTEGGGKVLGSVRFPLGTPDFSSYLLQAQASGAQIVALASAGADTINAIKGASEFGLSVDGRQKVATLLNFITDVHGMGLEQAQGLLLSTAYYWNQDDESREFGRRFFERTQRMPTMVQAGMYSAAMHYLRSIEAEGTDDATRVMAKMKATPIDDFFSRGGTIRADGLHVHDMLLMQVKTPEESTEPWDYYDFQTRIAAEDAFSPPVEGACATVE